MKRYIRSNSATYRVIDPNIKELNYGHALSATERKSFLSSADSLLSTAVADIERRLSEEFSRPISIRVHSDHIARDGEGAYINVTLSADQANYSCDEYIYLDGRYKKTAEAIADDFVRGFTGRRGYSYYIPDSLVFTDEITDISSVAQLRKLPSATRRAIAYRTQNINLMYDIARKKDNSLKLSLVQNERCPQEVAEILLQDPSDSVRYHAIDEFFSKDQEMLSKIVANDPSEKVRSCAQYWLNKNFPTAEYLEEQEREYQQYLLEQEQKQAARAQQAASKRRKLLLSRLQDFYGPEYDIPEDLYDDIVAEWDRLLANTITYNKPNLWYRGEDWCENAWNSGKISEDEYDELVQDGCPDCYVSEAVEKFLPGTFD